MVHFTNMMQNIEFKTIKYEDLIDFQKEFVISPRQRYNRILEI
jgi:hypothetical protein